MDGRRRLKYSLRFLKKNEKNIISSYLSCTVPQQIVFYAFQILKLNEPSICYFCFICLHYIVFVTSNEKN